MTSLSGIRRFDPNHRFFDLLHSMLINVDGLAISIQVILGLPFKTYAQESMGLDCQQFNMSVKVPIGGPLPGVLAGHSVQGIDVDFAPKQAGWAATYSVNGLALVLNNVGAQTLTVFFERYRPWIETNFGKDVKAWPALFAFIWAVRNAAVHHEGTVNFTNHNHPGVSWYGLSYSPADNGIRKVIGGDMSIGDMVVLIVEVSDELDRLGCPVV